jgi:hypothetical protein
MSASGGEFLDLKAAYRIMTVLMEALSAQSDLVAQMAQMLGEEGSRPLAQHPSWARYLEAKRKLEGVHDDMHRFAEAVAVLIERENAAGDGVGSPARPGGGPPSGSPVEGGSE